MAKHVLSVPEKDKKYFWHPFTHMKSYLSQEPLIIEEADGVMLKDVQGNWYIDGVSSLWCNLHGHRRKEIDEAIKAQLAKVAHSTTLGLTNIPAAQLAERLARISPSGLNHIFYSDDGSTAVEVALKMAFCYWQEKEGRARTKFISFENAYHGDTLGAVSVGGIELFHSRFRPLLFQNFVAPSPYCYRCSLGKDPSSCRLACLKKLEQILAENKGEVAAVIIEPLVQAAGGMIVAPEGFLSGVRELTCRYNTMLIADEVAVGFGRTGKMFACQWEDVSPDLMAVAKGLTAGYLPLAATLATDEIFEAFLGDDARKTFFHGHTFTGNPLASAAALASLDIFEKENVLENLRPKISLLEKRLAQFSQLNGVGDIRQKGLIAGIELVRDRKTKEPFPTEEKIGIKVCLKARKHGVIIRPLGDVIVIMPPLAISTSQLEALLDAIYASIEAVTES